MPAIRGNPSEKWVRRASQASPDYAAGVRSPRRSWKEATVAAAGAQAAGIQAAIAAHRFERGVAKAGDQRWMDKAAGKGAERFGPGVAEAEADYASGFEPYARTIQATNLPPRGARGDVRNYQRVIAMGQALRAQKETLSGGK